MSQTHTELDGSVIAKKPSSLFPRPENNIYRHVHFILNVTVLAGSLVTLGLFVSLYKVLTNSGTLVWTPIFLTIIIIGYVFAWVLTRKGLVSFGAGIFLTCCLLVTTQILFSNALSVLSLIAYLANAMIGLIILGAFAAYVITSLSIGIFIFSVAIDRFKPFTSDPTNPANAGVSDVMFISLAILLIVWLGNYMIRSLNKTNIELKNQSTSLQKALANIEQKRALGEDVSQQVFSLTAELNAIAQQQASGSQQQAAALTQVTSFLTEMTATAQSIANKTTILDEAAQEIKGITNQVKTASQQNNLVGESGVEAVAETISGNLRVNALYSELSGILENMTQQQTEIRKIVSIIGDISDETRLLSLNAAIEAAGAGVYGQRFAVVAAEVKNLSDRSVKASQEVGTTLGQVEEYIQRAVSVTESGHKEIETALIAAQKSGDVLQTLVEAIHHTSGEIEEINKATTVMSVQSREISYATNQQYSSSHQALETLQSIGTVAAQYASGSANVTKSTQVLEDLSQSLLQTLGSNSLE